MKSVFRPRWLSILAIAALSFAGIRLAAGWLLPGAHERLVQQYCQQISAMPEDRATRFVVHLAENNAQWAEVIVAATADLRPAVVSTAERELRSLVLRLSRSPAEETSSAAAHLARALAITAPHLAPDRRILATSLASELLTWPLDGRLVDAGQFIADCEAVLLLPVSEPIEIRVAAAPPAPQEFSAPSQVLEPPLSEPQPQLPPVIQSPSVVQPPPVVLTTEPVPPLAPPPSPNEPQRFVPGRSIRISDD
jgi:hypothetical protein